MTTHKQNQQNEDKKNNGSTNLSDAANKMRTSPDPQERSEAAHEMGKAGGSSSGGAGQSHSQNQKDKGQSKGSGDSNLSDAANKMRTSSDPKERSEAAHEMGKAGGSSSGGSNNSSGSSNRS
ncbi:MAG: hypothetical protein ACK4M7_05855 [Burkholderiales bacterium]